MKKYLVAPAGLLLFTATLTLSSVQAQNGDMAKNNKAQLSFGIPSSIATKVVAANNTLAFLDARLVKKFTRQFPEATDAIWYRDGRQTRFYFHGDGVFVRTAMKDNGEFSYVIRYYEASKLPGNIQRQVKNQYKGYQLTNVTELTVSDGTAYFITLDALKDWRQVVFVNDEISEYAHFTH